MMLRRGWMIGFAFCAACAAAPVQDYPPPSFQNYPAPYSREKRDTGTVGQGWFGLGQVQTRDVDIDPSLGEVTDVSEATMPVIGGAIQKRLGGDDVELGVEGGINFGWQGHIDAVVVGGGGAAVSGDTELLLTDLFAGPYLAAKVGSKGRFYVAAGLTLEWALIDLEWDDPVDGHEHVDENGFGGGYYGRTGFEFQMGPGTWVGFGVRYVDTSIDPSGQVDNFDLQQIQYLLTVTRSI